MLAHKRAKYDEEARLSRLLFSDPNDILEAEEPKEESDDDSDTSRKKTNAQYSPVWHDEDDEEVDVGSALDTQGRRLPDGGVNSKTNQYTNLLKHKYETLVGTPDWAKLDEYKEENSDDEICQTVGHVAKSKSISLDKNHIVYKRLKHLNIATGNEGPIINVVKFHPKSSVALVGGSSGIASLVTVDGRHNEKLHCVAFKRFPIHSAQFTPSGNEAFIGSVSNFYYLYDLMNAKALRVPLPNGITKMKRFELSSCGKYLAIVGRFGEIHLLCAQSRELIKTLKLEGHVKALFFSPDSKKLFAHSSEGCVVVWNILTLRVLHKFTDEGCITGTSLSISPSGDYLATGSAEGIVNIYETRDVLLSATPQPKKTLKNLTTRISHLKFNSTSEMLAFSSTDKKTAIRIAHLPSFQVFSNFPGPNAETGHCSDVDFSPHSGYMGFGSNKKLAYLYRINHYKNY
ncbi:U3 small nucleolar RNA-associated protein 18 homolog wicked [Arctopsyche grandis]|uniref:U3 small nucleolar RNA-associated protein 18 homolog wicked n=1 Tax=Arctopsyche grandis TaxID=121162 RepID=UPI00406DA35C